MSELTVTITIDQALGLTTDLVAKAGTTVLQLKEQLAATDPTGGLKADGFSFGISPGGAPIPDSTRLSKEHSKLDILVGVEAPAAAPPASPASPAAAPAPATGPLVSSEKQLGKLDGQRPVWEVVGGADKGGIMVRTGQDLKSPAASDRLATGSTVEQLEIAGERLHYKIVSGSGPEEGWVSIRLGAKDLLVPQGGARAQEPEVPDLWEPPSEKAKSAQAILDAIGRPYEVLGLEPGARSGTIRRAYHCLALLHHPDKGGDELVFKAIADAYKALTEAKDEATGGWRDLEGQAVGPWPAHAASTKGVTCMLFDSFGAPPWESRRIYTGSWQESSVRCWELSKGEPGKVRPPPRLIGEIQVGGFINDLCAIGPFGMVTAQSAGMKPIFGESLRSWNLRETPFKAPLPGNKQMLQNDGGSGGAPAIENQESHMRPEDGQLAVRDSMTSSRPELKANTDEISIPDSGALDDISTMVKLHYRGVRGLSLWPRPESGMTPALMASVSKDVLAVSKIGNDGCSIEFQEATQVGNPHDITDINAIKHESLEKLWTGDNKGIVKCWDMTRPGSKDDMCVSKMAIRAGWLSSMEVFAKAGVLLCSHSDGITFMDSRAGEVIRQQTTKSAVNKIVALHGDHPHLFAGVGPELMQYDTRCFKDGKDSKPKAIGQWTMQDNISSICVAPTRKGHLLVGVGCLNGKVACFDST